MEENLKQLLLKDLCTRLPYGVKLGFSKEDKGSPLTIISFNIRTGSLETEENENLNNCSIIRHIYQSYCYKPYLRPMSSMTEEEKEEFHKECEKDYKIAVNEANNLYKSKFDEYSPLLSSYHKNDWLNAHHFDYRGLIPMGLALEAPKGMYK